MTLFHCTRNSWHRWICSTHHNKYSSTILKTADTAPEWSFFTCLYILFTGEHLLAFCSNNISYTQKQLFQNQLRFVTYYILCSFWHIRVRFSFHLRISFHLNNFVQLIRLQLTDSEYFPNFTMFSYTLLVSWSVQVTVYYWSYQISDELYITGLATLFAYLTLLCPIWLIVYLYSDISVWLSVMDLTYLSVAAYHCYHQPVRLSITGATGLSYCMVVNLCLTACNCCDESVCLPITSVTNLSNCLSIVRSICLLAYHWCLQSVGLSALVWSICLICRLSLSLTSVYLFPCYRSCYLSAF